MSKLIQSISTSAIIWSFVIIVVLGTIVILWDKKRLKEKRRKELEERKKHHLNCLLPFDPSEDIYATDDREVEFFRK